MSGFISKPSARAEAVTRRTYNRPKNDDGDVLETWDETVERATRVHHRRLWEQAGGRVNEAELQELHDLVLHRKALVAGRTLWLGGTDYSSSRACSQFNCLGGETPVLIKDRGMIPIREAVGIVDIYDSNGDWTTSEIRSFGEQQLMTVEFRFHRHRLRLRVTPMHNWVLEDGTRLPTVLLREGDRIVFNNPQRPTNLDGEDYYQGIKHGLFYGDGTKTTYDGFTLRQFTDADDVRNILHDMIGTSQPSVPGAVCFSIPKSQAWTDLKQLPALDSSDAYLVGFIRGWLAADGSVSAASQVTICVGSEESAWLQQHGPRLGYFFAGETNLAEETNYGVRKKDSRTLRFHTASLVVDDLILPRKAARFSPCRMVYAYAGPVQDEPIVTEEVFCAIVPTTADFTISGGLLTGNCSYTRANSVYEIVDIFWLLLNGCGVGFRPIAGTLQGFMQRIPKLTLVPSSQPPDHKGNPENVETMPAESNNYVWHVKIGDSAEAWAKSIGKLLNSPKSRINELVLDFSDVRGPGKRLKGYGWICNGSAPLERAYGKIFDILNSKVGELLDEIDLLDLVNWLGTVLSSRRSAQIAIMDYGHTRWQQFAMAKQNFWVCNTCGSQNTSKGTCNECMAFDTNNHRQQSNNSVVFWYKPTKREIRSIMQLIWDCGGSEPGFINGETARKRAPWFDGLNPSLRAGTRVLTDRGIVPIETLDGQIFQVRNLDGRWSQATCGLSGKDKPLWKLELQGGHTYYATEEHKWPVHLNGRFVKLTTAELMEGDYLPVFRKHTLFRGTSGTREEGFFLGWLLGDGWITRRSDNGAIQVGLIVGEEDIRNGIRDRLTDFLRSVDCQANFRPSSGDAKSEELNTQNRVLTDLLERFGIESKESGLSDTIFATASDEFITGLLDGLFSADATVCHKGRDRRVRYQSVHEKLIRDVSDLLGFYGIKNSVRQYTHTSRMSFPNGKDYDREYGIWVLDIADFRSIQHFSEVVRLSHRRKRELLGKLLERASTKRLQNDGLIKIKSVTKTDLTEDVWDISVFDETHCFQLAHCVTGNCAEILLQTRGFCNLVTTAAPKFSRDFSGLLRALHIMGRANYRQTCVDLNDGILSREWNQTNEALRLCGMSLTGIAQARWFTDYQIKQMRDAAVSGACSMASELGLPKPKLITTIKPEGTGSKILDVTEGIHKPLGRFIFNWINFSKMDPIVSLLAEANYRILDNPTDPNNKLICFPVEYHGCDFDRTDKGKEVNLDTAIRQLDTYRRWNTLWTDHNTSITVSWDINEIDEIVEWLYRYWDDFVAVSWLRRADPTKSAKDLGYPYLPQDVVEERTFREYAGQVQEVDWSELHGIHDVVMDDCASGQCPIK